LRTQYNNFRNSFELENLYTVDKRIRNQSGAFLMPILLSDPATVQDKIQHLIQLRISIPGKKKAQVLKDLDVIGINLAFIYPDLSNAAQYLKDPRLHDDLN